MCGRVALQGGDFATDCLARRRGRNQHLLVGVMAKGMNIVFDPASTWDRFEGSAFGLGFGLTANALGGAPDPQMVAPAPPSTARPVPPQMRRRTRHLH